MPIEPRKRLLEEAERAVNRYVEEHTAFGIDSEQPIYRGGTNCVTFGSCGERPIVFKYFVTPQRWIHELFCLRHFQAARIVPEVIDALPERLIVMERLGGADVLGEVEGGSLSQAQVQRLSHQIGRALGQIADTPLPTGAEGYSPIRDFPFLAWDERMSRVLERYLMMSRRIQEVIPAYASPFCHASLELLESQIGRVDGERHLLFHEDISNMRVEKERFLGFYDLEMCRLGTESMQLGVALGLCGLNRLSWAELQRGYEGEVGRRLEEADRVSALAMNHLYHWIRVCRWGLWDGDPGATDHLRASTEDAAFYLARMQEACRALGPDTEVTRRFGIGEQLW